MTAEGFAADLGSMLGDGADLAPLMGTFSFSGRDLNKHNSSDEEGDPPARKFGTTGEWDNRESASNFYPDNSGDSNGEEEEREYSSFSDIPDGARTTRHTEVIEGANSTGSA